MTNQHPITPPPELVQQWFTEWDNTQNDDCYRDYESHIFVATRAAQWGANQELEACCEWLHWQNLATHSELIPSLRTARRPNPPSLKKQALTALGLIETDNVNTVSTFCESINTVRRALEALPDD